MWFDLDWFFDRSKCNCKKYVKINITYTQYNNRVDAKHNIKYIKTNMTEWKLLIIYETYQVNIYRLYIASMCCFLVFIYLFKILLISLFNLYINAIYHANKK